MNHEERRVAMERRRLAAADGELASDLAAEFEERAVTVARERRVHRRRFIVGCIVAACLGLVGTVLVATTSRPPAALDAARPAPTTVVASSPAMPAPPPARVERVALREVERRAVFRAIVLAEDRAELQSQRIAPHSGRLTARERLQRAKRHHTKFQQLSESERQELDGTLVSRYGITREEIAEIEREGVVKDWGYEVPVPAPSKSAASRPRVPSLPAPVRPSSTHLPTQAP